ncbi:hypothetical protein K2X05_04995 [bacterium]|nr:hypothetical protein [bacterium]
MDDVLSFLEQLQYESRPIFYAILSVFSFLNKEISPVLFFSGVILAVCSFYVAKMRYSYRMRLHIK